MADIVTELNTIYNDWMGYEIRFPIHDAIKKINDQLNEQDDGQETAEEVSQDG